MQSFCLLDVWGRVLGDWKQDSHSQRKQAMKNNGNLVIFFLLLMLALSILVYSRMPDMIATHWGISGTADGYSNKNFGLFFLPIFSFLLYGLLTWLPNLDPKKITLTSSNLLTKSLFFSFSSSFSTFIFLPFYGIWDIKSPLIKLLRLPLLLCFMEWGY